MGNSLEKHLPSFHTRITRCSSHLPTSLKKKTASFESSGSVL
nr:MAG TPA: hypothetical protein [Caudoviricetes sp.]